MRTNEERAQIAQLHNDGYNNCEISRLLNIPRCTVRDIINKPAVKIMTVFNPSLFSEEEKKAYAYMLGIYLGDGHIIKQPRTYKIRIFLDAKYPNLIEECKNNLQTILPNNIVNSSTAQFKGKDSCVTVYAHNQQLCSMFPQHGPGKKHDRKIELETWQQEIVDQYPKQFVRGLFHSDGCRYLQKNNEKYQYYSYNFTNCSKDIINLFSATLDKLNIYHRIVSKFTNVGTPCQVINIQTRKSSLELDEFLGPKT